MSILLRERCNMNGVIDGGATVYGQGDYGSYWSSSPCGGSYPEYARFLNFDAYDIVDPSGDSTRALGQSVRCFKNSSTSITIHPNG